MSIKSAVKSMIAFSNEMAKNTFPIVIQWERHGGYLFKNKFYSVSSSNDATCASSFASKAASSSSLNLPFWPKPKC